MPNLSRPAAGCGVRVPLAAREELALSFNPSDAVFRKKDSALLLFFSDGAFIEIPDFFQDGGIPRLGVVLADGSRTDAAELLALFAPGIALQSSAGLSGYARESALSAGPGLTDLASLAGGDEGYLAFTEAALDDTARQNLLPVYQDVEFRDGEIVFGPSVYGNFLRLGEETLLHVHLDNSEEETLDMDSLIARLPNQFPGRGSVRHIAVTGGANTRILLDGAKLSNRRETVPLEGFGTTQFDRYEYRPGPEGTLALYIETILPVISIPG